jgi:hypothetical protein
VEVVSSSQAKVISQGATDMVDIAQPLTAREAIEQCDQSDMAAGICLFQQHGLNVLYVNQWMEAFVGRSNEEILASNPSKLFLSSADAVASLNRLEQTLLEQGSVKDFELISKRSNGNYGVFVVDAKLVNWTGINARITFYKCFSPVVS